MCKVERSRQNRKGTQRTLDGHIGDAPRATSPEILKLFVGHGPEFERKSPQLSLSVRSSTINLAKTHCAACAEAACSRLGDMPLTCTLCRSAKRCAAVRLPSSALIRCRASCPTMTPGFGSGTGKLRPPVICLLLKAFAGLGLEAAAAAVLPAPVLAEESSLAVAIPAASSALVKDLRRLLKRVCALAMTSRELRRLALRKLRRKLVCEIVCIGILHSHISHLPEGDADRDMRVIVLLSPPRCGETSVP